MEIAVLTIILVLSIIIGWFVLRQQVFKEIDQLKSSGDVDGLKSVAQQSWHSRRGRLAVEALDALGYRCVYHPAEGHDEVVGYSFYCHYSDTVSDCQANCVESHKCSKEPNTKIWIVDKPKSVEFIKRGGTQAFTGNRN